MPLRRVLARYPLAIAWLVLFVYGAPGQMTPDTFEHLIEARSGVYTDGHPPAINLLYWLSDHTFGGQLGVFLVQSVALVGGFYALMRRFFAPRAAAWLAAGLLLYPPILSPLPVVWKDALMPALLLLGCAGLLDVRRGVRLLGLGALFAAIALRYNAFAAALPLVVLLFEWRPGLPWIKRYAIAIAAWLGITLGAFAANDALVDQEMHYWHSSLALHDIVGTLAHVDETIPDAELAAVFAGTELAVTTDIHATLRGLYTPRNFFALVSGPTAAWHGLPVRGVEPAPQPRLDAIARAWRHLVTTYPTAYVEHRLRVFAEVISLSHRSTTWPIPARSYPYPQTAIDVGISTEASRVQHAMTDALRVLYRATPLWEPTLYLAVALLLLPLARRHRDVLALLASGLVMELSLLPLAASPDYRYSHWMVVCTCVAVVVLIARRARAPAQTSL